MMGDIRDMARGPMPVHLRDWVEDQIYNVTGDGNRHAMRRLAADMYAAGHNDGAIFARLAVHNDIDAAKRSETNAD